MRYPNLYIPYFVVTKVAHFCRNLNGIQSIKIHKIFRIEVLPYSANSCILNHFNPFR